MLRLIPLLFLFACSTPGHRTHTPNITNFVRSIEYTDDFSVLTRWHETITHPPKLTDCKQGDCKERAICKYFTFRKHGYKPSQLNLWSGDYDNHSHMILVVQRKDGQYVYDADNSITPAKDYFYKHFQPSYRFNEIGWDIQ